MYKAPNANSRFASLIQVVENLIFFRVVMSCKKIKRKVLLHRVKTTISSECRDIFLSRCTIIKVY